MQDTVGGFPDPYPMFSESWTLDPGTVSGRPTAFPVYSMDEYPWDNQGMEASHATDPMPPLPSTASAVTEVLAKTNPSRPEVSVPNFLFELKDIPEMLHLKGQSHSKTRRSNSVAAYNFGWNLLFQDITRLLDFTSQVDKRVKELTRLHQKGGLKRRRTVYSEQVTQRDPSTDFQTFNVHVSGQRSRTTTRKAWVTVRWKPDSPGMPTAEDLVHQARAVVHGWDFSSSGLASTIWEAIPWSWLTDYFFNMGDFLNATRNAVGCQPVNACYMVRTYTKWLTEVTGVSPGFTAHPATGVFKTQSRVLGLASLDASLPFLSNQQMATLLGIAANLGR